MISDLLTYVSWIFLGIGSFFVLAGSIGLYRMPDLFTRIHAAGVIDTMGATFLLAGMALQAGFSLVTAKLAFVFILLFFTSPVATHALAQAALADGVKPLSQDGENDVDDEDMLLPHQGKQSSTDQAGKSSANKQESDEV